MVGGRHEHTQDARQVVCEEATAGSQQLLEMQPRALAEVLHGSLPFSCDKLAAFSETLALASFKQREVSITLARPWDSDCPLIGISDGFERLTGYTREEILGRNCRFLNQGCVVSATDRHAMRVCLRTGQSFTGVLRNRRKNGEFFSNLLTMRTLRIGELPYIVGVQMDVTNIEVDLASDTTASDEITALVDAIFSASIEARITQSPLSKEAANYQKARDAFVSVEASLYQNKLKILKTFWDVYNDDATAKLTKLRNVMSEPILGASSSSCLLDQNSPTEDRLPPCYRGMAARPLVPLSNPTPVPLSNPTFSRTLSHTWNTAELGSTTTREEPAEGLSKEYGVAASTIAEQPLEAMVAQLTIAEQPIETIVADLPSVGSVDHPKDCKPCSFFCYSVMGCEKGVECTFCHMEHPRRTRKRAHRKKKGEKEEDDNDEVDFKAEGLDMAPDGLAKSRSRKRESTKVRDCDAAVAPVVRDLS